MLRVDSKGEWAQCLAKEVKLGDVLKIVKEERLVADLVLLHSSDTETQQAFIQTSSLDGEKNLKVRMPPQNYKYNKM